MRILSLSTVMGALTLAGAGQALAYDDFAGQGSLSADLRVQADGTIVADLTPDAAGLDASEVLYATLPLEDGASQVVPLQYDGSCYRGSAGPDARIVPGRVVIRAGGSGRYIDGRYAGSWGAQVPATSGYASGPQRIVVNGVAVDVYVLPDGSIQAVLADSTWPVDQFAGSQVQLGYDVGGVRQVVPLSWSTGRRCWLGRASAPTWSRGAVIGSFRRPVFARAVWGRPPARRIVVAPRFPSRRFVVRAPAPPAFRVVRASPQRFRHDDRFDHRGERIDHRRDRSDDRGDRFDHRGDRRSHHRF